MPPAPADFPDCVLRVLFGFSGNSDPLVGARLLPNVDSGTFKLHLRAPTGMRIEETANLCDQVEQAIRHEIPAAEFQSVIDNIGLPYSGINLSYSNSAPVGTSDADILVTLSANHHPTDNYIHELRLTLPKQFPGATFAFLPADMVSQILNLVCRLPSMFRSWETTWRRTGSMQTRCSKK